MVTEQAAPIRVLVVDDHAVVRRGLLAFLASEPDLEVVGDAEGGAQAMELLAELDGQGLLPGVVLMDLQMEPQDGIASTRQIKDRYGDEVAVVALTSFGEQERVRAALRAGATGYLLKDADADEVAVAVRAAHRGEVQLDPAVARTLTAPLRTQERNRARDMTTRELEVLRLLGVGATNKGIARALGISERTARSHVSSILSKLGLRSRTQAALWATREGLTDAAGSPPGDDARL
jgi:DNA-binding NarL/FixJ family response regulator